MSFTSQYNQLKRRVRFDDNNPIGNDLALFGKRLNNERLQIAFSIGWLLHKDVYDGTAYYSLIGPPQFECNKNHWASYNTNLIIDGITISVPNYYNEEEVLLTGTRQSTMKAGDMITIR